MKTTDCPFYLDDDAFQKLVDGYMADNVLGHASINTTKIYTDKDRTRLAETLNKVSASLLGSDGPDWAPSDDLLFWLESL
jgi:hypothetical protein